MLCGLISVLWQLLFQGLFLQNPGQFYRLEPDYIGLNILSQTLFKKFALNTLSIFIKGILLKIRLNLSRKPWKI